MKYFYGQSPSSADSRRAVEGMCTECLLTS